MNSKDIIQTFNEWEDIIYDNIESFEKEFCHGASLHNVYWNFDTIKVLFDVDDHTLATDNKSIDNWFEWMESLKTRIHS